MLDRGSAHRTRRQIPIVTPPVQPDFLCFVEGTHEEANPDGEQLDFGQRDFDVAGNDQALIEHPIEHIYESGGTMGPWELESHEFWDYILTFNGDATNRGPYG